MTTKGEGAQPLGHGLPDMSKANSERLTSLEPSSKAAKRSFSQRRSSFGGGGVPNSAPTRLKAYKSNSRSKWVNREIAALEFLLGIPLEAEQDIVRKGWMQQQGIVEDIDGKPLEEDEIKEDILEPPVPHVFSGSRSTQLSTHSHQGRWWEKWITNHPRGPQGVGDMNSRRRQIEDEELEQPDELRATAGSLINPDNNTSSENPHDEQPVVVHVVHAPGRRLQGYEPTKISIPIRDEATTVITRQKSIAQISYMREWEIRVAHGIGNTPNENPIKAPVPSHMQVRPPMLDGRLFFSAGESYPIGVFSLLRYEPKKEEAARQRQKLEARGGGGTQFFIMPVRDWRGISYRALLPPRSSKRQNKTYNSLLMFDRFASSTPDALDRAKSKKEKVGRSGDELDLDDDDDDDDDDDEDDDEDEIDEEEDTYVVGLLDDPEMVQGRHRNVMIGDRGTGPIVSSSIQFVKPALLKADLNKQFRERFDGWEPPKSQRKYIGARVIDGVYTLMDPGQGGDDANVAILEEDQQTLTSVVSGTSLGASVTPRKKINSLSSLSVGGGTGGDSKETIRMPPSLTLSKIRSIKQQSLLAALQAKLEISTVALAIVYFERLCLDCRVDKTNRRLSFAACLLLALKMNEAHVELITTNPETSEAETSTATGGNRMQSLIRPSKAKGNMLASLLEYFTQEWNLSLKHLFAAEWGVFAALQFRLHAKPSQVAFHFRRLLKAMDWNPRAYLGPQMHEYWMDALSEEDYFRLRREERRKALQERKERKTIVHLQRELHRVESGGGMSRLEISDQDDDDNNTRHEALKDASSNDGKDSGPLSPLWSSPRKSGRNHSRGGGLGRILTHFAGGKRVLSSDKLSVTEKQQDEDQEAFPRLPLSPSMPSFPTISSFVASDNSPTKLYLENESPVNVNKGNEDDDGWILP